MNFDFPAPYDHEVPRRIGEARQELSPEGVEVLEPLMAQAGSPEDVVGEMALLPQHEINILLALNKLFQEAYHARMAENQGWLDLHRQMERIFRKARELDPTCAARGGAVTFGEAVAVLKRRGVPVGLSDEVLEMTVEVPREE